MYFINSKIVIATNGVCIIRNFTTIGNQEKNIDWRERENKKCENP